MNDKPFANPFGEMTVIKNLIIDRIMPKLSSDGWKVLCAAMRRTWGGMDAISYGRREAQIQIDHDQFAVGTGIQDPDALAKALDECLAVGLLVRHPDEQKSGQTRLLYALNTEFEIVRVEPVTVGPETEQMQEMPALAFPSPEHEHAFQALMDYGSEMEVDPNPERVHAAVIDNDPDAVLAWIETGREMSHLAKPKRFETVVQRLLDKVPPLPLAAFGPDLQPDAAHEDGEIAPPELQSDDPAAEQLWQATLEQLESQVRKSKLKWLLPTRGVEFTAGTLTVAVPNKRTKDWLQEGQLAATIQQALESVAGEPIGLTFIVSP